MLLYSKKFVNYNSLTAEWVEKYPYDTEHPVIDKIFKKIFFQYKCSLYQYCEVSLKSDHGI